MYYAPRSTLTVKVYEGERHRHPIQSVFTSSSINMVQASALIITTFVVIGLGCSSGTLIHKKVEAVVGATAAIAHKVHDVKEKKVEFVKDVSHKTWSAVKAVNQKGLAWASSWLPKKEVAVTRPTLNVVYKVHKYHGVHVQPVVHSVQPTHIQVQHRPVYYKPISAHPNEGHSSINTISHSPSPYPYSEWKQPGIKPYNPEHNSHTPVFSQETNTGGWSADQTSYVNNDEQKEWKSVVYKPYTEQLNVQQWTADSNQEPPVNNHHTPILSQGTNTGGWSNDQISYVNNDERKEWKPVVYKPYTEQSNVQQWTAASNSAPPANEKTVNTWQDQSATGGQQWQLSSSEQAEAAGPAQPFAVRYSVTHPGHATSYKKFQQEFPSQPLQIQSHQDTRESPYNQKPLRNSYGDIIEDTGYSPSENADVVVPAPAISKTQGVNGRSQLAEEPLQILVSDELQNNTTEYSSSSNATTTATS